MSFYDDASWLLVPSGIEEDIVFAQKPISGLGDLTFTRASDATYTDSTGVVRRSPYNLLQQSEMFSNAIWTKTGSTIGIDATVAPNGTLTADKLIEDTALSTHLVLQLPAGSISGNIYTFSFYAKAAERFNVSAVNNAAGGGQATYNLNTGVVTFTSGISASMQSVGNGWYRCILTYSPTVTGNFNTHIRLANASGANSYQGDGVSGAFIWGAQLVEGTSALDYFPTTNRQDVPRIDFRNADGTLSSCGRLLLEPQRTNSIRNSSMVGAVAGSPGTLPTNWAVTNLSGLTQTIVGTGVENGLYYFDIRYNGTATSTSSIDVRDEANTQIAAANGQSWTHTAYLRLVSAVVPPASVQIGIYERTSTGIFVVGGFANAAITSTLQRFSLNRTLSGGATVAFTQPLIQFSVNNATAYDFTIRIAAPQMELGAYATTWVPTTTAAVTRLADTASKTGVSSLIGQTEGTLFIDVNFDTRQLFSYFLIRNNPTTSNFIGIGILQNDIRFEVVNGSNQALIVFSNNSTGRFKIAAAYKQNDFVLYVNGVQRGSDNSGTVPSCSEINAFVNGLAVQPMQYTQAALFPTRLPNATLAQLTTL